MRTLNPSLELQIVPIDDPFGPTITDPDIDAIIGSTEVSTLKGCLAVNTKREERGMTPLHIVATSRTLKNLSSTWIRNWVVARGEQEQAAAAADESESKRQKL